MIKTISLQKAENKNLNIDFVMIVKIVYARDYGINFNWYYTNPIDYLLILTIAARGCGLALEVLPLG